MRNIILLFIGLFFASLSDVFGQNLKTKAFTIVLDAGHGGKDPGALGTGRYNKTEKDIALDVTLKLGKYLKNRFPEIKIIYTRGISGHGYGYDSDITPQLYVIKKKNKLHISKKFISLGYSQHVLSDNSYLSRIKHINRLEQVLGYVNKDANNFDNHIMTNGNREIIECINSNIFFYKYRNVLVIYTPILNDSGVDGILKQEIIKTFQKKKVKVKNKNIKRADIKLYDGCFICNSINGVQFVNKISNKSLNHIEYLEELLDKYIYE